MNKKQLHICHSLELGGISTFVKSLVALNDGSAIKHHILVWNQSAQGNDIIDISNDQNKKEALKTIIADYDKLFVHSLKPFMIPMLRKRKKDVYLFQHGMTFGSGKRKLYKLFLYFTVINILGFKVVCSSQFAKQKLLKHFSVFNKKLLKIIPFGVHLDHSDAVNETSNNLTIGFVGRLVAQKRIHKIYEALELMDSTDTVNFRIAGTGVLMEALKLKASNFSNSNVNFVFDGHVHDMAAFFSKIDVLILPSLAESYGLVVLEAFAHNIPAVVFDDTGACVEFIINGKNGFVVKNSSELSKLIDDLKSSDLRSKLKSNILNMDLSQYHLSNTKSLLDEL